MTDPFWRTLNRVLLVPTEPPDLPIEDPADIERLRPTRGYLWYLVTQRWLSVWAAMFGLAVTSVVLSLEGQTPGLLRALVVAALVSPAIGAALHLAAVARFKTTWFTIGRNSLRIRRGLWKITEATITYSNVQNVTVEQGPIQRLFGFSSVKVETAGGGSRSTRAAGHPGLQVLLAVLQLALSVLPGGAAFGSVGTGAAGKRSSSVPGTMAGLRDPLEVRTTVMRHVRRSRDAGLGDAGVPRGITERHVRALREIRDALGESP